MANDSQTILKRINIKGALGSTSGIGNSDGSDSSTASTAATTTSSSMFASVFASAKS